MASIQRKINSTNYNNNILGFVPSLIIQYLLDKETRKFPEKQSFKTVVMFADISGFTNLSETLQKRGNEGSELLAFVLNRYMELLVKSIGKSGGDIFKFAGDAMIVLWPPPLSDGSQLNSDLLKLCRQAVQSGLDIKQKLNGALIFEKKLRLSVKIGFGIGEVTIMHVGGVFQRAEYLPAGDPLTQAFECEHQATGGGQVIVTNQVWELINEYFHGEMIKNHHSTSKNAPFFLVNNLKIGQSAVQMKADAVLMRNKISQGAIQTILPLLESYIPKALLPYIKIDQEKWSAELRRLSIMFLNLGIDLSAAKTEEGLHRIQCIIKTVQSCLYQNEGSLNKLLMDDKGSTLIVVFGLPPLAHQDDPVRGILAAFKLLDELTKINCTCSIGLTTGLVFSGVVGTSGNRREYSVLGDTVNLSARLMQAACGEKEYKILVDEETKKDAEHKIRFKFFECRTVKGKTGQIPIYIPINCLEEVQPLNDEGGYILKTHQYNMPDDAFMIDQYKDSLFMLRREVETNFVMNLLMEFLQNETKKAVFIRGDYGIGKTLFLRCVLESLKMHLSNEKKQWEGENLFIFVNGFNPLSQKKKLNGWRKFLCFSIEKLKIRNNFLSFLEVFHLLQLENSEIKTIINVLDLDINQVRKKEIIIDKEKIMKEETQIIRNFCFILIEKLIEKTFSPLVICFDDMQNFDEESWLLVLDILDYFEKKIFFFFLIRDTNLETSINKAIFSKYFKRIQKYLKKEENKQFSACLNLKEIKIVDSLSLARKILGVNDIPDNLLYFLYQKTKGNPLKFIQLLQNLLQHNLISKNMEALIISEELYHLFYINEFITLPLPLASIKINNSILDRLTCKQILLLKVASTMGDSFTLTMLKKLNPFKDGGIPTDEVENILRELEKNEILGIIDETESNITFMFLPLFFREVVYQRMTYNQRRELHKLFAESIQSFPSLDSKVKTYEKMQTEKLMFHWKMAENQSSENPEEKKYNLSSLAKRSVIVKKISSLATTRYLNPLSILRKGFLHYKINDLFWNKKFFVLTFKDLKFYNNEEELSEKSEKFIGLIILKQIFSIAFMSRKNRNVFLLKSGSFQTKDNDIGLVQIYFSHEEFDILEEWATYIEFARAKAIYDDFVNTFGKISFPLQSEQRMIKKERALRKKIKNKIESSQSSMSIGFKERTITDSLKDFGVDNVTYLQTKQKKLKEGLTVFINHSLLLFLTNIIEKSGGEQNKEKFLCLGKFNNFTQKFPNLFSVKPNLIEDEEETMTVLEKQFTESLSSKKKSVSIDIKPANDFDKKLSRSQFFDDNESENENVDSDDEEKVNLPAESIDIRPMRYNKKSSKINNDQTMRNSSSNNNNNNNKIFTFNSTNSFEINNEKRQSIASDLNRTTSGLIPPTPKMIKILSQIQEEDTEIDQKQSFFQKSFLKLTNSNKKLFRLQSTTENMPSILYSRRNSISNYQKKPDAQRHSLLKPRNNEIKGKKKNLRNNTCTYFYAEYEKSQSEGLSEKKPIREILDNSMNIKNPPKKQNNLINVKSPEITKHFLKSEIKKKIDPTEKPKIFKSEQKNDSIYQRFNEEIDDSEIIKIKNNGKFSYGLTLKNSIPLEGDKFVIPKNELVVIMEIFSSLRKMQCLWKGFIGVFPFEDIQVIYLQKCHQNSTF